MGIVLSSAVCAFVCGITEPFEFAFMFLSPVLYAVYALLYGIVSFVTVISGFRAGFSFSAGVTDLVFSASLPAVAEMNRNLAAMKERAGKEEAAVIDAEILVHAGLDTVRLNGEGFRVHVREGERVRQGQLIMEMDPELIRARGFNPMIIVARIRP